MTWAVHTDTCQGALTLSAVLLPFDRKADCRSIPSASHLSDTLLHRLTLRWCTLGIQGRYRQ